MRLLRFARNDSTPVIAREQRDRGNLVVSDADS